MSALTQKHFIFLLIILFEAQEIFSAPKLDPRFNKLPREFRNAVKLLRELCEDNTGIKDDQIDEIKRGNIANSQINKDYLSCIWLESTMIDVEGNLNIELINNLSPGSLRNTFPELVVFCHKKESDRLSMEDKIFNMVRCMYEEDPKNFIVI